MTRNESNNTTDDHDPRQSPEYEEVLCGYLDQLNEAGLVDPEAILVEHPDLGSALLDDIQNYIELRSEGQSIGTLVRALIIPHCTHPPRGGQSAAKPALRGPHDHAHAPQAEMRGAHEPFRC